MKRKIFHLKIVLGFLIAAFLLLGSSLAAQDEEAKVWLELVEAASAAGLSVNVEELGVDSFFDVFVDVVLREGLPPDIEDPILGTALTSDEVTAILRKTPGIERLFQALGALTLPDGQILDITPGAAVHKYDREGRWSRGPHNFGIYTWVMVNQWIRASMNKTRIVWKVFKPGVYSTDCMYLNIHSNAPMQLILENRGPLASPGGTAAIPTAYALSSYIQTPQDLVLQGQTMMGAPPVIDWVPNGGIAAADVGPHLLMKVWNSIFVGANVGPGLYSEPGGGPSAIITVAPTF